MKHKIISAVILLALEAIIISLALWAGEYFDIPTNILVLDIVVLTILLLLGGYESFQPLFAMVRSQSLSTFLMETSHLRWI